MDTQIVAERAPVGLAGAVAVLKLLADETRLRIVWNLLHDEHSVNELAEHLGLQPAAVSHHLARLRHSGAVRTRRDGNRIFYAVEDPHIAALVRATLPGAEAPPPDHHTSP